MWDYEFVTKLIRTEEKIVFHKGNHIFKRWGKIIFKIADEIKINNPSFLQKYRYLIVEGPKLLETDETNDIIYTDYNGRRAFNKDVKVLSWF